MKRLTLFLLASLVSAPAFAQSEPTCPMMSVVINYNMTGNTYSEVKEEFDQKIRALDEFVKTQNIPKFELQNMAVNLHNDQAYAMGRSGVRKGGSFHLSGSTEYMLPSSENAFRIGNFLTQQKFEVAVSSKVLRGVPCTTDEPTLPLTPAGGQAAPAAPVIAPAATAPAHLAPIMPVPSTTLSQPPAAPPHS